MKKCATCKIGKESKDFGKNRSTVDGLHTECKQCRKDYRIRNLETIKAYEKQYNADHKKEKELYHIANKERLNEYALNWYYNNKSRTLHTKKKRRQTDINFRLADNLRSRLYQAMINGQKTGSAVSDLGCSMKDFKIYIERQFQPGMSWDNWGLYGWHLDHIIPLDAFVLTDSEQFLKACHYTNYQPLWAKDNLMKTNKLNWSK